LNSGLQALFFLHLLIISSLKISNFVVIVLISYFS
jgi:hypothetical protein